MLIKLTSLYLYRFKQINILKYGKKMLTPEESLLLITKIIQDTKNRLKENGFIIIFWGILMFVVTLSQFILFQLESKKIIDFVYTIRNWPVFLYPLGAIFTFVYSWKKHRKNNLPLNIIGRILGSLGWIIGMNLMILGFFFESQLGKVLMPVFLILLSFIITLSGIAIKFKPLLICGIILNLIGFATFHFEWQYHSLIASIASVIGIIIPGIWFNINQKSEHV